MFVVQELNKFYTNFLSVKFHENCGSFLIVSPYPDFFTSIMGINFFPGDFHSWKVNSLSYNIFLCLKILWKMLHV